MAVWIRVLVATVAIMAVAAEGTAIEIDFQPQSPVSQGQGSGNLNDSHDLPRPKIAACPAPIRRQSVRFQQMPAFAGQLRVCTAPTILPVFDADITIKQGATALLALHCQLTC